MGDRSYDFAQMGVGSCVLGYEDRESMMPSPGPLVMDLCVH